MGWTRKTRTETRSGRRRTRSSAHSFSFLICASSSGVKSLTMLKLRAGEGERDARGQLQVLEGGEGGREGTHSFRISSGCLPLIMLATVLHPTSLRAGRDGAQGGRTGARSAHVRAGERARDEGEEGTHRRGLMSR